VEAAISSLPIIQVEQLEKTYWQAGRPVPVLKDLSLTVDTGEYVALMGSSGAGKTTLLQLLGCLDQATRGSYQLDGLEVSALDEEALAAVRNRKLGFVFQTSHFVDYLDLVDNVALPGFYASMLDGEHRRGRAIELLTRVGMAHRQDHVPAALSGGERQRVAIARALFNDPRVILADEPTGNLDADNTANIMAMLADLNRQGITIVMVTHDGDVASQATRVIELASGSVHDRLA
jgi:putative ABC transport system ATP-binding protein